MDRRLGLASLLRRGFALALAVTVTALAGGCAQLHTYDDVWYGRNACKGTCSDWSRYGTVMRGENACDSGPCAAKPACAPCASPCAPPPCAPPPCAPPPCRPVAVAPCAQPAPCPQPCKVLIPAEYETITETVCTQCAGCKRIWIPPVQEIRSREVCATPACAQEIEIPGASRTVHTCEVVCPARTETRTTTVMDACGCPKICETTVEIPAQTVMRSHEVCIQPPTKKVVYTPPLYRTEPYAVEVKPGFWKTVEVPAVYETVTRRVCKTPERWEWRTPAAPAPAPAPMMVAPAAAAPAPAPMAPAPAAPAVPAEAPTPAVPAGR